VNGAKMSKSRGTFVMARTYLDAGLDPEALRYYFAVKTGAGVVDLDLNLEDFVARVNADLVGKFVNIASRCAGFIGKRFDGLLADALPEPAMYARFVEGAHEIARSYARDEFGQAMRQAMALADEANRYIDEHKPWVIAKREGSDAELQAVCSQGLNLFRVLAAALKPVLPRTAERAERFLDAPVPQWDAIARPLLGHRIHAFEPLLTRIDPKQIAAMVEASTESLKPVEAVTQQQQQPLPSPPLAREGVKAGQPEAVPGPGSRVPTERSEGIGRAAAAAAKQLNPAASPSPQSPVASPGNISIDDFAKLDLRIAVVTACELVEGSDKLLRVTLDAGELGTRQIFSGIRAAYGEPERLIGRKVVFIANLAPRKMRFGVSEGMILSAGSGGADLFLLDADSGAQAGMTVK